MIVQNILIVRIEAVTPTSLCRKIRMRWSNGRRDLSDRTSSISTLLRLILRLGLVLRLRLVLRLGLRRRISGRLILGLWLILWLGWDGCGRLWDVISGRLESVFSCRVAYCPPLTRWVDVAVLSPPRPIGIGLFLELNSVLLGVRGSEFPVSREVPLLREDGRLPRVALIG